jgi:hypothetical protein
MQTTISNFPDFIGVFKNGLPNELCDTVVDNFEKLHAAGFSVSRQNFEDISKLEKHDDTVFASQQLNYMGYASKQVLSCIWDNAYKEYAATFSILNMCATHNISELKIQKTLIGGGYHTWHCEADSPYRARRLIAYTIYLNDVEEGGETEFLYYPRRIKPTKGTIVLFPCGYSHTHRGNPPISNTKYIATGWIEF